MKSPENLPRGRDAEAIIRQWRREDPDDLGEGMLGSFKDYLCPGWDVLQQVRYNPPKEPPKEKTRKKTSAKR